MMREDNLLCLKQACLQAGHNRLATIAGVVWPNLARHMKPMAIEPAMGGRHHLCPARPKPSSIWRSILDAFSRKVVGWALENHLSADLALDALEMALGRTGPVAKGRLIHHTDRGVQYACGDYIARLEARRNPALA